MSIRRWITENYRYRQLLYLAFFVLIAVYWLIYSRQISPKLLYLLALGVVAVIPLKGWLRDWRPFILLPLSYGAMQGIGGVLSEHVNITNIIQWEKSLFGGIQTIQLQERFHANGSYAWYDAGFMSFYLTHYFFPYLVAIFLYFKRRALYHLYTDGFVVLAVAGFFTYVLFPAMPPWMASAQGFLPAMPHLLVEVAQQALHVSFPSLYQTLGANQVAAMPSMHAAWPLFIALCLTLFFRWKGLAWFIIPAMVSLAIVYFGEHYIIDVVIGYLYALAAFGIAVCFRPKKIENPSHAPPTVS